MAKILWNVLSLNKKTMDKFEKVDYKLRKAKLDISFLVRCQNENIPNFLEFLLAKKTFDIQLPMLNVNNVS